MPEEPEAIVIQVQEAKPRPVARKTAPKRPATKEDFDAVRGDFSSPEEKALTAEPVVFETEPRRDLIGSPEKLEKSGPNSSPPSLAEWQDFLGRVVLKSLANGYTALMIRDAELTQREHDSIMLTREDLAEMSAPLASLAHKSKFGKKRGRAIIAATDSYEAVLAFGIWMRRVHRIARKYRNAAPAQSQTVSGVYVGPSEEESNGYSGQNASQGTYPGGYGIYNPGTG